MKKSLLAVAALTAFAGAAQAQSSVTVYGVIDMGLIGGNANTNGSTATTKTSGAGVITGGESTSRIGFKGTEDLGGGVSAFFTIENKLDPDSSTLISTSRQAFVGLKKNGIGSASIGAQNTPIYDAVLATDPSGVNNMAGNLVTLSKKGDQTEQAASSGVATNAAYATRLSNTVVFKSETFAGFTGRGMILAKTANSTETTQGNGTVAGVGGPNNQSGWGLGLDYTWQKLNITANYQTFRASAATNVITTAPVLFSAAGVVTGGTNAQDNGSYIAGVYDFGILKAAYQYVSRKVSDDQNINNYSKYTANQIGVNSYVTPTIQAWATAGMGKYTAMPATLAASPYVPNQANINGMQFGANYWLSKRTNLYAIYGQTATSNVRLSSATGAYTSYNQNNYALGVRHTF